MILHFGMIFRVRSRRDDVVIRQATLAEIPCPSDFNIKAMQAWFTRADLGDIPIRGPNGQIWTESSDSRASRNAEDLIAINRNAAKAVEPFTTWLLNHTVYACG